MIASIRTKPADQKNCYHRENKFNYKSFWWVGIGGSGDFYRGKARGEGGRKETVKWDLSR
jgi:hypothetical protein